MTPDAEDRRDFSFLVPNWKTTEFGLAGQRLSRKVNVTKLSESGFKIADGVADQAGLNGAISQLNEAREIWVIHRDDDLTQRGKLSRGLSIGLALTTSSGCENEYAEVALADRGVFHSLRHDIVHGRSISREKLGNVGDKGWLEDGSKVLLVFKNRPVLDFGRACRVAS